MPRKSCGETAPIWRRGPKSGGLLMNFNVTRLKDGLKRFVL